MSALEQAKAHVESANQISTSESMADFLLRLAAVEAQIAVAEKLDDANYVLGRIFDEMQSTRVVGL